jgi:glycosyltransferase involved in cell wall biosynthesis
MSEKVMKDLRSFEHSKPARQVLHPLYDNFGDPVSREEARSHLQLSANERLVLFFGFIRQYKGLDLLFRAIGHLKSSGFLEKSKVKFLIAGEYYEEEKPYQALIDELGIREYLHLRTNFIPDSEVRYYLCAADVVIQPYRNATQSGVTPLAYHFEKPMIVTNVGSLPDLVPDGQSGLVCEPEPVSIAAAIERYFQLGEEFFLHHLREEKKKYSWEKLVAAIEEVAIKKDPSY